MISRNKVRLCKHKFVENLLLIIVNHLNQFMNVMNVNQNILNQMIIQDVIPFQNKELKIVKLMKIKVHVKNVFKVIGENQM